jgi:glutamate-5-semialdehyde dehydrogenase
MGHADGICHIYVDKDADQEMALRVITDAKTQYTAACNAVETLLVSRDIAGDFLPLLAESLKKCGVKLRGTKEVNDIIDVEKILYTVNGMAASPLFVKVKVAVPLPVKA